MTEISENFSRKMLQLASETTNPDFEALDPGYPVEDLDNYIMTHLRHLIGAGLVRVGGIQQTNTRRWIYHGPVSLTPAGRLMLA
ncbi:hypothetical protein [Acetobacter cerevisiae]|uniref:hypothetical protein n=1 Tax=Acetobacter cerevisiae TaxID=178900 RepID=UPI00209C8F41|nr:hypothetical protein [Acetobacter cerevisiae]MCP1270929.1 hypothetical protein [Acetobacter cerevisiae]MCP1278840.1 hypothetical protein [Acetobacter cerevisiae]